MGSDYERLIFLKRTREMYDRELGHCRRLGRRLRYRLADLRGFLLRRLERGRCTFCGELFSVQNIEMDYLAPIARGGNFTFSNLEAFCRNCSILRGGLDSQEYRQLWHMLHAWARPFRTELLERLRAGTPAFRAKKANQRAARTPPRRKGAA